ncbi:hypothetical protein PNEG_00531 [Pneumocystis murina B123]|uniref:RRM domain-containing protein n=1 Tax=Pneumocystis murina (strain B123) TaxID=1069680 RepID=M7PC91_PNEMU|nr:hypothetical protein PNEG_00531 [Pneumocystis murina B123]EMR11520.1 hypothetical protein PNEG_00531 [Pneumocystis murina B123]
MLHEMFIPFGEIVGVELPRDETTEEPHQGFGYVEFEHIEDAREAIDNMDQSEVWGRILHVTTAKAERKILEGLGSKIPVWEQEAWIQQYQINKEDRKIVEEKQEIIQSSFVPVGPRPL